MEIFFPLIFSCYNMWWNVFQCCAQNRPEKNHTFTREKVNEIPQSKSSIASQFPFQLTDLHTVTASLDMCFGYATCCSVIAANNSSSSSPQTYFDTKISIFSEYAFIFVLLCLIKKLCVKKIGKLLVSLSRFYGSIH